jgi:hypothetical protein
MAAVVMPDGEVLALLAAAKERDKLSEALRRVQELADGWHSRGEHLMAYSKTPGIPEEIADSLLCAGAEFVESARKVRAAINGTR